VRRRRQIESAKLAAEVKIICTLASRAIVIIAQRKLGLTFVLFLIVLFFYHSSLGGALNLIQWSCSDLLGAQLDTVSIWPHAN